MNDYPAAIKISEEGPREGFQIEKQPIATANKVRLIDALSLTGVDSIEICSFVSKKLVPGWADAEAVVRDVTPQSHVAHTALWFSPTGFDRALAFRDKLTLHGNFSLSASEAFLLKNLHRTHAQALIALEQQAELYREAGIPAFRLDVMAAFGCNYVGDIACQTVIRVINDGLNRLAQENAAITEVTLADTMGWATPDRVERVVGAVRERWPHLSIRLHLHDTRGLGIANAYAGLRLGVDRFDTSIAGLGGCPFAGEQGAPGNIATEELVLLCDELGIATGIDLEALLETARLAESIIGRRLPSAALRGGSLRRLRATNSSTVNHVDKGSRTS